MPQGNGTGPNRGGRFWGGCKRFLGQGRGRGNRNMFRATGLTGWQRAAVGLGGVAMSREEELAGLHSEVEAMEEAKKAAQERIAELEKGEGSKE